MKSPFPGMDPYIEACGLWEDFHSDLIGEIKSALGQILPEQYSARIGERAYITRASGKRFQTERHSMQGDVTIVSPSARSGGASPASPASTAVLESPEVSTEAGSVEMVAIELTEFRETFIEIRSHNPDRQLVTTIEVLSPSNKRRGSEGWEQYQRKRNAHLMGAANLVEIDLLRGGQRMPMETPWPDSPYTLLVCRQRKVPNCIAWRASFNTALPTIPIPLAHPDPDVMLTLQPMIEAIYNRSRYSADIDYNKPCIPPFAPADEEWFKKRLAQSATAPTPRGSSS